MGIKINEGGYCEKCNSGHNCINCEVMDQLMIFKKELIDVIEKKLNKKKKPVYCGCGRIMLKSKFKNGAEHWCPCSKNKRY